jgi:hypothetical protein
MAKQFTGIDGALYLDGNKVGKIVDWSLSAAADVLETTTLGDFHRTYIYGVQQHSGSCTLLYYEEDSGAITGSGLISDVLRTTQTPTAPTHTLELRYENGARTHAVKFKALLNQVELAAAVGSVMTANIAFTVTGALETASLV